MVAVACVKGYIPSTANADKINAILQKESEATGDPSLAKDGTAYECWEEGWLCEVHEVCLDDEARLRLHLRANEAKAA